MDAHYSGSSLGPHEGEKEIRRSAPRPKRFAIGTHQIPAALILVALMSFGGNMAFGYLSLVNKSLDSEMAPRTGVLGSDDTDTLVPPILVPSTHFVSVPRPSVLKLRSESYLVIDAETGEIILEKDADAPHPMASISKLMTAIVTKEQIDLHHVAVVTDDSYNTYGSEGELSRGEKIIVSDLLYPLLIESSNDAAEVLADDYGRGNFIDLLNQKAAALGMSNTHYDDPSGLSPFNVSTARDLGILALYIRQSYPEFLDITRVKEYAILDHTWKNENYFLTYPNFLGGKNGFINEARKTTVSYFKVFFRGEDPSSRVVERPIVVVLLRSADRNKDMADMLSYVSKNIRYVP